MNTSQLTYDNFRVNTGQEHKDTKNLNLINLEKCWHVPQNMLFQFTMLTHPRKLLT